MKIAAIQMRVKSSDLEENFSTLTRLVNLAVRDHGANLIVCPEMCLPGYLLGDAWEREAFLHSCEAFGERLARLAQGDLHIIFGNVACDWSKRNEDGRVRKYNAAFHAWNGQLQINPALEVPYWPKTLMPNYREFDDSRHFYDLRKLSAERNVPLASCLAPMRLSFGSGKSLTFGVGICEDGWSDDYGLSPFKILAAHHSDIEAFINISCSPYTFGKQDKRERTLASLTQSTAKPLLYVNAVGVQNNGKTIFGFDGSSCAVTPFGAVSYRGPFFEEHVGVLSFENASEQKNTNNNEHETKSFVALAAPAPAPVSLVTSTRPAQLHCALESIVSFCLQEWQITRVVIGASGGIDSALSAVLFARVLGAQNVFLVNMPSRFNSSLTRQAAAALAQNLGCPFAEAPIEDALTLTCTELKNLNFSNSTCQPKVTPFVLENIQARDRGCRLLAGIAASLGTVFTCNANKAELTVGYSTLYGDQAGFLAPLADLWKGDVYALARHYNDVVFGREIIPQATLEVVPSAELNGEQDVTKAAGDPFVYPYHDCLFRSWVEHWRRKTPFDCLQAYAQGSLDTLIGCEPGLSQTLFPDLTLFLADLERWWILYAGMGAFKRVQAPPLVALSPRAFGFDHREPIGPVVFDTGYLELKSQLLKT